MEEKIHHDRGVKCTVLVEFLRQTKAKRSTTL